MRTYLLPLGLTIAANVVYHFSQKSVPRTANPLLVLLAAYVVSILVTVVLLVTTSGVPAGASIRALHWSPITMGLAIVGALTES